MKGQLAGALPNYSINTEEPIQLYKAYREMLQFRVSIEELI